MAAAARTHRLLFPFAFPRVRIPHRCLPLLPSPPGAGIHHRRLRPQLVIQRMVSGESQSTPSSTRIALPNGDSVEILAAPGVSDSDLRNAVNSFVFKQWLKNISSETGLLAGGLSLRQVYIQGVDMFGRGVGFLKFKANIVDKETQTKIPGIVFARGPAVAVLILLDSGGKTYVVLTEQPRVPVGKLILEIPAGMIDDEAGDIIGTAVREVEEEIGISLKKENMVNLTAFLDPNTGCKVFPSPGGCDEELSLFLYKGTADEETIAALQGKEMGLRDHGELIKVHVVPYDRLWQVTADMKALAAIALYEMAKRNGLLL
ncbi:nudix hydrolase 14, chloroplastic-like [Zingiber officinale]|uniref:Nudix hydrolase domain-containing protein n=1 Tax=Zingiber officinale TaxID=94328 RepID=A0A8J5BTU7_ZINOF|nr:nudix hydrolase 14, chloroplastic-like [Zingiber officinale]KAG6467238.1 hypothetical protein ZIOFF_074926 [Zingiber officinale]